MVNSRQALFAAAPFGFPREEVHLLGAPLLPKLRGQLAEFLREGYPARLSILCPPTCVGLRYGHRRFTGREAISWQCGPGPSPGKTPGSLLPLRLGAGILARPVIALRVWRD